MKQSFFVGFALVTIWPYFSVFVADHTLVANSNYCSRPPSNVDTNATWISNLDGIWPISKYQLEDKMCVPLKMTKN